MFFSLIFYINYCKRAFSSVSHNFSSFGDDNLPEFLNGVTIRQTKNIWDLKKCSITRDDLYENTLQVYLWLCSKTCNEKCKSSASLNRCNQGRNVT